MQHITQTTTHANIYKQQHMQTYTTHITAIEQHVQHSFCYLLIYSGYMLLFVVYAVRCCICCCILLYSGYTLYMSLYSGYMYLYVVYVAMCCYEHKTSLSKGTLALGLGLGLLVQPIDIRVQGLGLAIIV